MNHTELTKATTATAVTNNPETMNGEIITTMMLGIITVMITATITTMMAKTVVTITTTTTIAGTMTATPHTEIGEPLAEAMEVIQTRGEEEETALRHRLRHHQIVAPTTKMG